MHAFNAEVYPLTDVTWPVNAALRFSAPTGSTTAKRFLATTGTTEEDRARLLQRYMLLQLYRETDGQQPR